MYAQRANILGQSSADFYGRNRLIDKSIVTKLYYRLYAVNSWQIALFLAVPAALASARASFKIG